MTSETATPDVLTFEQTAAFLGIKERTLRRWIAERGVPHARIGGFLRFRREALVEWVASQEERTMDGRANG